MKHPAGSIKPRRLSTPRRRVRLDLQRRPTPEPDDELGVRQKGHFWKWLGLVALLHVVIISLVYWIYETASAPKPPEQFLSLLPAGAVVKGTPGAQEAHKLGPTTSAPAVHHASAPPPPQTPVVQPKPATPPPAAIQPPKPVLKTEAPTLLTDKPILPPKPVTPKPPKVKVDLNLADGPVADKPVTKPKPHLKKPVAKTADDSESHEDTAKPDSAGLSKEQIAAKLGEKLDAAGVKNATQPGTSGSSNSRANPFADFYASIRDQAMNQWQSPNLSDENAVDPIVHIHVEKDGRVPPESVRLLQSSGNPAYDDSAVSAAKSLGYLHEPLPDGCPPDISITFKPNR
jgi:TonB family protein